MFDLGACYRKNVAKITFLIYTLISVANSKRT